MPHLLEHDPGPLKDGGSWGVVQAKRRTVDMHDLRSGRSLPALEKDPVGLDPPNMAEPEYVLDLTHGVQIARAEHGPAVHGWRPRRIDANEPTCVLESLDEIADA